MALATKQRVRKSKPTAADVAAIDAALDTLPDELVEPLNDLQDSLLLIAASDNLDIVVPADEIDGALKTVESAENQQSVYERLEREAMENADQLASNKDVPELIATKPKQPKRKKAAQAEGEGETAPVVEPEEKPRKQHRVHFHTHSKGAVLLDRIGGNRDLLILEESDNELPTDELHAKQDALLEDLNKVVAKKVAEKAIMLVRGGVATQEVMRRTFNVLARDGYLASGDKGNLIQDLLKKPFSIGTARSQANQMFALLPFMKIAHMTAKGRLEPNDKSILLKRVLGSLAIEMHAKA